MLTGNNERLERFLTTVSHLDQLQQMYEKGKEKIKHGCNHPLLVIVGRYHNPEEKTKVCVCYCLGCNQRFVLEMSHKENLPRLEEMLDLSYLTTSFIELERTEDGIKRLIDETYLATIVPIFKKSIQEKGIVSVEDIKNRMINILTVKPRIGSLFSR